MFALVAPPQKALYSWNGCILNLHLTTYRHQRVKSRPLKNPIDRWWTPLLLVILIHLSFMYFDLSSTHLLLQFMLRCVYNTIDTFTFPNGLRDMIKSFKLSIGNLYEFCQTCSLTNHKMFYSQWVCSSRINHVRYIYGLTSAQLEIHL